jgi:hypothetical protein
MQTLRFTLDRSFSWELASDEDGKENALIRSPPSIAPSGWQRLGDDPKIPMSRLTLDFAFGHIVLRMNARGSILCPLNG